MAISYTETFDLDAAGAWDDLGMTLREDDRLRAALDADDGRNVQLDIEERITAKLREHGVSDEGEWLGDWSAVDIVTEVLDARGL